MATFVVLFLMTGSVILPLKAILMNVLTLSAAFGLLVLIFQDGRLEGLLDYESLGALDLTQPVVLFAVAFGLSTDYGVFLLARIKEARDHGASDREAVAIGLERTGRIVTAAALLFCVAIGAFATSQIIFIKEVGLGTALAVLHRRDDRPRAARAVADGAARQVELVGAAAAAAAARAVRAVGGRDAAHARAGVATTRQPGTSRRMTGCWPRSEDRTPLKRAISRNMLLLFVVGDVLGAGIYALVGEVAGRVGGAAWASFMVALGLAVFTAFSYAELVTKYPTPAAPALYANKAFRKPFLTFLVTFAVMMSGVTSAATLARAFGGDYLARVRRRADGGRRRSSSSSSSR